MSTSYRQIKSTRSLTSQQIEKTEAKQSTTWVFTYFPQIDPLNTEDEGELYLPFDPYQESICYFTGQWEFTTDNKPHFQGFVKFKQTCTVNQARSLLRFPGEAILDMPYLKPAYSTRAAIEYVQDPKKRIPGTEIEEVGNRPGIKGVADGYIQARALAESGANIMEVEKEFPMVYRQNSTALIRLCNMYEQKRMLDNPPKVYIFYGVTGAGKTHLARSMFPGAYEKNNTVWWTGYCREKVVIWNEFVPKLDKFSDVSIEDMLTWLDEGAAAIRYHGGLTQLHADTFVFTTNINPTDMYAGANPEQLKAFRRRITDIYYFPKKFNIHTMSEPYYIKQGWAQTGRELIMAEDLSVYTQNGWKEGDPVKRKRDEIVIDDQSDPKQSKLSTWFG